MGKVEPPNRTLEHDASSSVRHCFRSIRGLYAKGTQNMEPGTAIKTRIPETSSRRAVSLRRWVWMGSALVCFGWTTTTTRAALQFDVFLGYGGQPTGADGIVREAGWFPVGV